MRLSHYNMAKELSFDKKLEKELSDLPDEWIVLLETSAENSLKVSLTALKLLINKGYAGIILSASRPCSNILDLYKKNEINTKNIFILDCVCKNQGIKEKERREVMHLENASSLTEISLAINNVIGRIKNKKFVFVDSITTMLIHNKPELFAKFVHSILTKMRVNKINGLLVSLENETNKEVRAEIAQLCDKVVKV